MSKRTLEEEEERVDLGEFMNSSKDHQNASAAKRAKSGPEEDAEESAGEETQITFQNDLQFSAQNFRKSLQSEETFKDALEELFLITSPENKNREEHIAEYFDAGGSCLELFQIFEFYSEKQHIIMTSCERLIFAVIQRHPEMQNTTLEACRYLLNTHLELINKMLNVGSAAMERWTVLRLLTAMVTFSTLLVKDILLNVRIHTKLLIRFEEDIEKSVRIAFINFVMSFFVEGNTTSILQVLARPYLMQSFMAGLRFDPASTVNLVLLMIKQHIIDMVVPKHLRVKLFNVVAVKGLVFLYDWRGENCYEEKRQRQVDGYVNEGDQEEIAKNVHAILLVLCTSIRQGVIFRDDTLGTGAIHRNPLMYNIVDMSFRNSTIGGLHQELIVKMAVELPDMVKTVWAKLLPLLEPRPGGNWNDSMRFVRQLISGIKPQTSIHYAKKLKPLQYAQVIQMLVTPTLVMERIITPDYRFPTITIRSQVTMTLVVILQAVRKFLAQAKHILPENYYRTLRRLLQDHLQRTMPTSVAYLYAEALQMKEVEAHPGAFLSYMTDVVHILEQYHVMCPDLLETIRFHTLSFVLTVDFAEYCDCEKQVLLKEKRLKIAMINLLTLLDPVKFSIAGNTLPRAIKTLSQYLKLDDTSEDTIDNVCHRAAYNCICAVLNVTGLFTDCMYEVDTWVDFLKYEEFRRFFCSLVPIALRRVTYIQGEIAEVRASLTHAPVAESDENTASVDNVLKRLCGDNYTTSMMVKSMKVNTFSPVMVLAMQQRHDTKLAEDLAKVIINVFHLQTDYHCFQAFVRKYQSNLCRDMVTYVTEWTETCAVQVDYVANTPACITAGVLFKLVHGVNTSEECRRLVEMVLPHAPLMLDLIYCHPKVLHFFQPWHDNPTSVNCVQFLTDITEQLKLMKDDEEENLNIDVYLKPYQRRVYNCILHLGTQRQGTAESKTEVDKLFTRIISVFGMNYDECLDIIESLSKQPHTHFIAENKNRGNQTYYVLAAVLDHCAQLCESSKGDDEKRQEGVKQAFRLLTELKRDEFDTSELAVALCKYIATFNLNLVRHEQILCDYIDTDLQVGNNNKGNAQLISKVFQMINISDSCLQDALERNLPFITKKKLFILPLLDLVTLDDRLVVIAYEQLASLLEVTLEKPSKCGQSFVDNYKGFCDMVERQVDAATAKKALTKVQKPDTTEVFFAAVLKAIFVKYLKSAEAKNGGQLESQSQNAVMTFVHYIISMLKAFQKKSEEDEKPAIDSVKLEEVCNLLWQVLAAVPRNITLKELRDNETFKVFCKLCLKHGVGDKQAYLMKTLTVLAKKLKFSLAESTELMEMLTGHSEFMGVALEAPGAAKLAVFDFVHVLCKNQPLMMERSHVPLLLAAYTATLHPADRRVLSVLYLYEERRDQTMIYDFKPFLWGQAASNFYTLRPDSRRGLWRQPRTGDLLDILEPAMIESTIVNFPRHTMLSCDPIDMELTEEISGKVYDVGFILSVLAQVLSNEYVLVTHKLTRSGAMALVAIALSAHHISTRTAACHALAKFYYHLEAQRSGKDNQLWLRFVEVVARAVGAVDNHKLNGFSSLFMARTALAISNPTDPMYSALGNFIGVKAAPDLTRIPEFLTFLYSSDVHYLTYRNFILQIIHDGLRSEEDYMVASGSRAMKLMMELFNSSICDVTSKDLILRIIERAVAMPHANRSICNTAGLSAWLCNVALTHSDSLLLERVDSIYQLSVKHKDMETVMVPVGMAIKKIVP